MTDSNNIAIVIPAYNEQQTIRHVIEQLMPYSKHIIVIDDGSTDKTIEQIEDLPITLLKNEHNLGKAQTLLHGFNHAMTLNVQGIITIDADTQHDPQDIPKFLAATSKYPGQIVIGARLNKTENAPPERLRANKIADFFISWAAGKRIVDTQSGYRYYPRQLIEQCINRREIHNRFVFESEILIYGTHKGFTPVAVVIDSCYPEDARKSHYRPLADTTRIVTMVSWKIISRGFYPPGLYRALFRPASIL